MKSSKRYKRGLLLAVLVVLSLALQACPEKEGPMEKAGEKVDEAVKDAERKVEDATD